MSNVNTTQLKGSSWCHCYDTKRIMLNLDALKRYFWSKELKHAYESMSKDELLSALKASESKNKTRTEKMREEIKKLQRKFSKPEIKETKKNQERLFRLKKYYGHDDAEYKGIKDMEDLFDLPIGEDYYKPIIVNSAFNNNYIQNESK